MAFDVSDIDGRLSFFAQLLSYDARFYLWTYSADGELIHTNCPDLVLEQFFLRSGGHGYMMERAAGQEAPLMLSGEMSMVWGAAFEREGKKLARIHVLGPVFTQTVSNLELEKVVWGKINPRWKPKYLRIMQRLPVLSVTTFLRYIQMLHFCVTGVHILGSDVMMQREPQEPAQPEGEEVEGLHGDRTQVYLAEQTMLRMIRNGDMNYHEVIQNASRTFTGRHRLSADTLQHAKLGHVQFIALCCAAAMDGGLSAEAAYSRKDAYIQAVEKAKSISEITELGRNMYADYVTLVHRQRQNPSYSKAVRSTCDYIENHLDQKMTAQLLADRVGYSSYYLSRRFKQETGFSIDEYTRNAKIERAKLLLSSTQDSIQQISDALGFSGRNYFAVTFKAVTGIPPAAYRKKYQKL